MKKHFQSKTLLFLLVALLCVTLATLVSCGECEHVYEDEVVTPTCTTGGYTVHTCKECGDQYTDTKVPKLGHSYTEVVTKEPTCTIAGSKTLTCSVCNDVITATIAKDPTAHTYSTVVVTPPTCDLPGYTTRTCACGASKTDTPVVATGHSYHSVVTAPTCTADGFTTHTCELCEYSYKDSAVAKVSHEYETVVTEPTCMAEGYTTYTCKHCADTYQDNRTQMLQHSWDNGTVTTVATCTVSGETTYHCQTHGCEEVKVVDTGVLAHSYASVVTPATCTTAGYTTHTCQYGCGASYTSNTVASLGHDWDTVGEITLAATCEEDGVRTYCCNRGTCEATKTEDIPHSGHDTAGHTASIVSRTAVSTFSLGSTSCQYVVVYKTECNNDDCEGVFETRTEVAHTYYWKITREATCAADGEKVHICSGCGELNPEAEPQSIPANTDGHIWDEGVTANGITTYTCTTTGCGETKTVVVSTDGSVSKDALTEAGSVKVENSESDVSAEFAFDSNVTGNLTSDNVTVSVDTATKDDLNVDDDVKEEIGDATIYSFHLKDGDTDVHELGGLVTITIPYTLSAGEDPDNLEIWYVMDNGEIDKFSARYSNGFAIFETDHFSFYAVVRLSPEQMCAKYTHLYVEEYYAKTCTRDAYTIKTCERCGDITRVDDEANKATGHSYSTDVHGATCFEGGYTLYECDNCDHSYKGDYTVALTHEWDNGTPVSATCKEQGHTVYTCVHGCGETYTDDYTDFAEHTWNSGIFTKTPGCTTSGTKQYICTVCQATRSEYVEALGHNYEASVTAPTCTAQGYTTHSCTRCDASYVDTYVAMVPHTWSNGVCTVCNGACTHAWGEYVYNNDATCTENGTETAPCTICDKETVREKVGTAKGHNYVNGVCSVCGDGCDHSWSEFVYNDDATCTEHGTKTHTCYNCGTSETVTAPSTATGHSYTNGVCTTCGSACVHNFVNGVCNVCGTIGQTSASGFYTSLISSILNSDSFLLELDEYSFNDSYLSVRGGYAHSNSMNMSGKMAIEFDEGGNPILKMVANGTETNDGITVPVVYESYYKDGVMYNMEKYVYSDKVIVDYDAQATDLSPLSYIFGQKEADVNGSVNSMFVMLSVLGEIDLDIVGDPINGLLDLFLLRTRTATGYEVTLDANKLHALNDSLRDDTIEALVNKILGENMYDTVVDYLASAVDKNMYEVITDIRAYLVDAGKMTEEEFNEFFEFMSGEDWEEIEEELSDEYLIELFEEMMNIDDPDELKILIQYNADRIGKFKVYDLVELMLVQQMGTEIDVHALVAEYIDQYASCIGLSIITDADGNFISASLDLDMEELEGGKIKATVTRNETFAYDSAALVSKFQTKEPTMVGAHESFTKTYGLVRNADGTYTLTYVTGGKDSEGSYEDGKMETEGFVTTYNGIACKVVYSNESTEFVNYIISDMLLIPDACLAYSDLGNNVECYEVSAANGTRYFVEASYARYYNLETGELVHEEVIGKETYEEGSSGSARFTFEYDKTNGNLVSIRIGNYHYSTHSYAAADMDAYEALACGSVYLESNVCLNCGVERSGEHYNIKYHSISLDASLVEGAHSCEDGVEYHAFCENCEEEFELDTGNLSTHCYSSTGGNGYSYEYCELCGIGEADIYGWQMSQQANYTDDNGNEHERVLYMLYDMRIAVKDSWSEVDGDGNTVNYTVYYFGAQLDDNLNVTGYNTRVISIEELGHTHNYVAADPQTETVDNGDGTTTMTNTILSVCACGETSVQVQEVVVDTADTSKIYSQYMGMTEAGVLTMYQKVQYVYVNGQQLIVLQEMAQGSQMQKVEMTYDAQGRNITETQTMSAYGMTMAVSYTYSYDAQGNRITVAFENSTLLNGTVVNWVKESYSTSGCSSTIVYEYKGENGTVLYTYTRVLAHTNTTENRELAPGADNCHDGVTVTVTCLDCGEVVDSYTEYDHDYNEEYVYRNGSFAIIKEGCMCSSHIRVEGASFDNVWIYDEEYGKEYELRYYRSYSDGLIYVVLVDEAHDAANCMMVASETYYETGTYDIHQLLITNNDGRFVGINTDMLRQCAQVSRGYTSHTYKYDSNTVTSTDANGNDVTAITNERYCEICGAEHFTTVSTTTSKNGVNIYREVITTNNATNEVTETRKFYFDSEGREVKVVSEYNDSKYEIEYVYYSCGYVTIETNTYSDGRSYSRVGDVHINHNSDKYVYEYSNLGSTSCEDGLDRLTYCSQCDLLLYTEKGASYSHEYYEKEAIWSSSYYDEMYGMKCGVFVVGCLCGEEESVQYRGNYHNMYDPNLEMEVVCFVDSMSNEPLYYLTVAPTTTTDRCTTTYTTVYSGGETLESVEEIYTYTRVVVEHSMGSEQAGDVVTGEKDGRVTYTTVYTSTCMNCDYNKTRTVYTECVGDDVLLERTTLAENGVDYEVEENQYTYDSLGNRYRTYYLKKNAHLWYDTVTVYDFEKCTYEATTKYYNTDGTVINSYTNRNSCHVEGDYVYSLREGSSTCEDGIYGTKYCLRCNAQLDRFSSSGEKAHSYKNNHGDPTVINTECGIVIVQEKLCACGQFGAVSVNSNHGCDFSNYRTQWLGSDAENGMYDAYVYTYRCMITGCAYTYTVHTYYGAPGDDCKRVYYQVYRFGTTEDHQITDDGCDLVIEVASSKSTYHQTEHQNTDSFGSYIETCTNCGNVIHEHCYDEQGNTVYEYDYNDGNPYSTTYERDQYGNVTLRRYESGNYWETIYYEYDYINAPCEYNRYSYGENSDGGSWDNGNEYHCEHWTYSVPLENSCTQYNAELILCHRCDYQETNDYGMPTQHYFYYDEELQTYVCSTCGLENETGVNGYFILEDLSGRYGSPAAGIYFPHLSERGDWWLNFGVYVTDYESGESRFVAVGVEDYDLYTVYSSGTIVISWDTYYSAIEGVDLGDNEYVSQFVFAFAIFDEDSGTYIDHEICVDVAN